MKLRSIYFSTALLIASGLAFAGTGGVGQAAHQSGTDQGQAMGMSGMSGCGMSVQQEVNLHQHMEMLRSQMSEIMRTTDPAKRQALMQQQMDNMDLMLHDMDNLHGSHGVASHSAMMNGNEAMHGFDSH